MDECEIPYTINLRAEEVEKFTNKLERITNDFTELKENDYEECSSDTKAGIRRLIDEMISKLTGFEDDKEEFIKF
jgi:Asp-tRNA(Asn)/Glu-tRNA(Gln) amidotransferase C subunit